LVNKLLDLFVSDFLGVRGRSFKVVIDPLSAVLVFRE